MKCDNKENISYRNTSVQNSAWLNISAPRWAIPGIKLSYYELNIFTHLPFLLEIPNSSGVIWEVLCQQYIIAQATFHLLLGHRGVELNFRPMVSRPVSLGFGPPFGAHDQILHVLYSGMYLILRVGRHLWREDGSVSCSAYHSLVRVAKDP
jgi:hypothetical protein